MSMALYGSKLKPKNKSVLHTLGTYDTRKLNPLGHILIHGKKGTGKSVIAGHLLYCLTKLGDGKLKRVAVMSATEKYNKTFERQYKVKPEFIRNDFDVEFLEMLMEHQQKMAKTVGSTNAKHGLLIILEDLAYDKSVFEHPLITQIMYNGRHFNTCLMIIVQEPLACPKRYRNCLDIVITTRENMGAQQKNLYEMYYGNFDNLPTFIHNLKHYTRTNHVLLLDNTVNAETVEQCVYTFKAPFRIEGKIIEISDPRHPEYEMHMKELEDKLKQNTDDTDETVVLTRRTAGLKRILDHEQGKYISKSKSETEHEESETESRMGGGGGSETGDDDNDEDEDEDGDDDEIKHLRKKIKLEKNDDTISIGSNDSEAVSDYMKSDNESNGGGGDNDDSDDEDNLDKSDMIKTELEIKKLKGKLNFANVEGEKCKQKKIERMAESGSQPLDIINKLSQPNFLAAQNSLSDSSNFMNSSSSSKPSVSKSTRDLLKRNITRKRNGSSNGASAFQENIKLKGIMKKPSSIQNDNSSDDEEDYDGIDDDGDSEQDQESDIEEHTDDENENESDSD